MMNKPALRQAAMQRRDILAERERRSVAICNQIIALPIYVAAQTMHCYLPMRSEVDTRPLIADALARGKRVAVPVVIPKASELVHTWLESLAADALVPGTFGTFNPRQLHPAAPGDWELIVVPLLAFDRRGNRLGYGKGFYDRLLIASAAPMLGVGFADQEVEALPAEAHDVPLSYIVTEREVIDTGSRTRPAKA